jgi:hypothetical protein
MHLGRMLVLLLYRHLAGNEHLPPRLIPVSSQTAVIPSSGLDGISYILAANATSASTAATTLADTNIKPTANA